MWLVEYQTKSGDWLPSSGMAQQVFKSRGEAEVVVAKLVHSYPYMVYRVVDALEGSPDVAS